MRRGPVHEARCVQVGEDLLALRGRQTANARRHLEIPTLLQPYLLRLASGKGPEDPLFGLSEVSHKPRPRQSMFKMVQVICQRAGVPRVCTHSLRGLWATLAVGSGVASHAVAASLGHHSFAMTQKHYAQPAAIVNAGTARVASPARPGDPGGAGPAFGCQPGQGGHVKLARWLAESIRNRSHGHPRAANSDGSYLAGPHRA